MKSHPMKVLLMIFVLASCGESSQHEEPISITYSIYDTGWKEAAEDRIREHRMGDWEIIVFDGNGKPISDATVEVKLTNHDFRFGALILQSRWEDQPNPEDAQRHREVIDDYFNTVVTIPSISPSGDAMLDWLNERDKRVRGHYLMWARIQPGQRRGQPDEWPDDVEELREMALQYIEDMVTWAGDRIDEWDVINHIVTRFGDHRGFDQLFGDEFFAEVIHFARELAPNIEFWVNEGGILWGDGPRQDLYYDVIQRLIENGAKPDGIGFMGHFKKEEDFISMEEIYRRLDRFAELIPNLQLTEYDIQIDDRQLQADFMKDMLTMTFSHPAVSGIVAWHVWAESSRNRIFWNPDWSIRPHGEAWMDLVFNEWWTDEQGRTNDDGLFHTRGFLGDYEITVQAGDEIKTVHRHLDPDGNRLELFFNP